MCSLVLNVLYCVVNRLFLSVPSVVTRLTEEQWPLPALLSSTHRAAAGAPFLDML